MLFSTAREIKETPRTPKGLGITAYADGAVQMYRTSNGSIMAEWKFRPVNDEGWCENTYNSLRGLIPASMVAKIMRSLNKQFR